MTEFFSSLQSWQLFFATVATAAAALTGLLFVSLSLNRERLTGKKSRFVLASARHTFSDFLYVLMISLVFLVPHKIPLSLTVALLVLGLSRGIGLIRESLRQRKGTRTKLGFIFIMREFGLPAIAAAGLIGIAFATLFGQPDSIYWLVGVIAALLLTACWRAWLLLVEE
jgi:hypothetical protein